MNHPSLKNPWETPLFIVAVVVNALIVIALVTNYWWVEQLPASISEGTAGQITRIALYALLLFIPAVILGRQIQRAAVLGTTVQLSREQFPDIYLLKESLTRVLGLPRDPEIYLANGNGALNAFASSAVGRDYVVFSNELFANLYNSNREGLAFIIGHELGHIRRNHTKIWYQLVTAYFAYIPFLNYCLSRAREYTCDRYGAWLSPNGIDGLVMLASGRYTQHQVNVAEILNQERQFRGVWAAIATIPQSHPLVIRRVKTVVDLGLLTPMHPAEFAARHGMAAAGPGGSPGVDAGGV